MAINQTVLINAAIESGLVDAETVAKLKVRAQRSRTNLLDVVMHHQRFPIAALYQSLASLRGLDYVLASEIQPDPALLQRIPDSLMQRNALLPLTEENGEIVVVVSDPDDRATLDMVRRIFGRPIRLLIAEPDAINAAVRLARQQRYGQSSLQQQSDNNFDPVAELDQIFKQAWLLRASDIHIEPQANSTQIRLRVDGQLQRYRLQFSASDGTSLISRVKVLAGLDITEQREPQDGGINYPLPAPAEKEIDVRIATIPTRWGERVTMRLLGQETQDLTLESIGMPALVLDRFRQAIARPYGLILLTGPTGSGKTTTLYGALREINRPETNIMTVEDPIEYLLDGIAQIQVSGKVSFAGALRSFLRHDPDVLMVGEIRDAETAGVALKAAMTGHLVFSTLHTNDAASAVSRLLDIGAERFLLASSLIGIIAQRLVRRLCQHCRQSTIATAEECLWLGAEKGQEITIYQPQGCPVCVGSGYRGRVGLYEALWIDAPVAHLIGEGGSEQQILSSAEDLLTLWQDGCDKVRAGLTTIDEVRRVTVFNSRVS